MPSETWYNSLDIGSDFDSSHYTQIHLDFIYSSAGHYPPQCERRIKKSKWLKNRLAADSICKIIETWNNATFTSPRFWSRRRSIEIQYEWTRASLRFQNSMKNFVNSFQKLAAQSTSPTSHRKVETNLFPSPPPSDLHPRFKAGANCSRQMGKVSRFSFVGERKCSGLSTVIATLWHEKAPKKQQERVRERITDRCDRRVALTDPSKS